MKSPGAIEKYEALARGILNGRTYVPAGEIVRSVTQVFASFW